MDRNYFEASQKWNHLKWKWFLVYNEIVQISRTIHMKLNSTLIYDAENANIEMHMWDNRNCAHGWE